MKKSLISILISLLSAICIISFSACNNKTSGTANPDSTTTNTLNPDSSAETDVVFSISSDELMLFVKESSFLTHNSSGDVKWSSSDSSVAEVDDKGNIYTHKKGSCTISCKNSEGEVAECKLSVYDCYDYIVLPDLKTLTIKQSDIDKEIEEMFKSMAEHFAEKVEASKDKLIENGDIAGISYSGILEGETEPFEGGTGKYDLEIGSKSFIDGFEEGLIGYKAGDVVTLNLTFPENYVNPDQDAEKAQKFNGKKVTFTVTVNKVYSMVPAEITDELVAKATNDAYKTIKEYSDFCETEYTQYLAIEEAIKNSEIKGYPDELVDYYNEIWIYNKFGMYAQYYGMTPVEFACKYYGYTEEKLYEQATTNTKAYLEQLYLLYSIICSEDFEVPAEKEEQILEEYAKTNSFESVEDLEKNVGKGHLDNYVTNVYAIELLTEWIKVTDDTAEEAK